MRSSHVRQLETVEVRELSLVAAAGYLLEVFH